MKSLLLSILLLSGAAQAKVLFGTSAVAPITFNTSASKFISTNQYRAIYQVRNVVGDDQGIVTTVVNYANNLPIVTNYGSIVITATTLYHVYNGRQIQVTALPQDHPSIDSYRGWTYSNVLVVAVDWTPTLWTGTTYCAQGGVTDVWDGLFITSGVFTTESVKAAQLATNLWPGADMIIVSSNSVDIQPDYWEYWYNDVSMYAAERVMPMNVNELPWNYETNGISFVRWSNSVVVPIQNYLASHKYIKMIALSYGMPDHTKWEAAGGGNATAPVIDTLYRSMGYSVNHNLSTNLQIFSFSCRTFDDTTNLLIRSSSFNVYHIEAGIALDVKAGYGAWSGFVWALDTSPLSNYYSDDSLIKYNPTSSDILTSNISVWLTWNWGWYIGYTPDNYRRTVTQFTPLPNSICGTIESYNFASMYTNPDNSRKKHGQSRAYDAFAPTANFGWFTGGPTNAPLYSRTYGCAFGHTKEPFYTGVYTAQDFYPNACKGYSFVECFFLIAQEWKLGNGHIVCGHPFMRITDFMVESTVPWDVSGLWPNYPH